jgi:hypothetical protein
MKTLSVALVFALALPTLASTAAAQEVTGDACALLTPAEASQALGAAVSAGQHIGTSTIGCIYSPSGKVGPSARLVIITLTPAQYFDMGNRTMGKTTAKPAAGLGTGAYFLQNRVGTNVHVRKGDRAFELRLQPGTGGAETQPQIEQKETALAQKAMARL